MRNHLSCFYAAMHRTLLLLAGALLAALPAPLPAQSVQFAGFQDAIGARFYNPFAVAVDGSGNLFVASGAGAVQEALASDGYTTALTLGTFNTPRGIAVDGGGNVFVTDSAANAVQEIVAAGGYKQIIPLGYGWDFPTGIAVDASGNVFVSDAFHGLVKEMPAGNYTTVSTLPLKLGEPDGLAVDSNGNLFVIDSQDDSLIEVFAAGGYATAKTLQTGFDNPFGLAVDPSDNVFVADQGELGQPSTYLVKEVFAIGGYKSQANIGTSLNAPMGVAVDRSGHVFITNQAYNRLDRVALGAVDFSDANICPVGQSCALPDSLTLAFNVSSDEILGASQVLTSGAPNLDFTSIGGTNCMGPKLAGSTCTVNITFAPTAPGARSGVVVLQDDNGNTLATAYLHGIGIGPALAFNPSPQPALGPLLSEPYGVAVDGSGNVFVADTANDAVREISAASGYTEANTLGSGFYQPSSVAVDNSGNVFVADLGNSAVKEIPAAGGYATVRTLSSSFKAPFAVAVDSTGNLFVADLDRSTVSKLFAESGFTKVQPLGSGFVEPSGLAVDSNGNVFVADTINNAVKEILAAGGYTTINTVGSEFRLPTGLAIDGSGNLFIADTGNSQLKMISAQGGYSSVELVGGSLDDLTGVAVDKNGNLFLAEHGATQVLELARSQPPSLNFAATPVDTTSSPQSIEVQNTGNTPLTLADLLIGPGASFTQLDGSSTVPDCTSGSFLQPNANCNLGISFTPLTAGAVSGAAVLIDNALNQNLASHIIPLTGTGILQTQTITFPTIPAQAVARSILLSASASSGLPVSFASDAPTVCTVSGKVATMITSGLCGIQATQPGNNVYQEVGAIQLFPVAGKVQKIRFNTIDVQMQGVSIELIASSTSGLGVNFLSRMPSICTVSGTTAKLIKTGTCILEAFQPGNNVYTAAAPVLQSFTVDPNHHAQR